MPVPIASRRAAPAGRHPSLKPVVLAVAAALGTPLAAFAGPVGPTVVNGAVQVFQPDANSMLIKQDSSKAIINWRSFSIGAGEHVTFQQPDSASVALNRVTTAATPSAIFGSLSANGKIFLVNPAGVMFGKGASVDVGGLVASTLAIRDDDFLAGRYVFTDGGGAGAVRNQGRLTAIDGGTIALLGAQVSNEGLISARLGTAGLAAGGKVTLDFGADGLTRIVVDAARINALVENGGAILSEGGQVTLSARALGALADTVVRNTGVVNARSLVERDGRILLDGGDAGRVEVAGTLDASGPHGGAVTVLGRDIALTGGAAIDARGDSGGGSVRVGGDYRGANPAIPHAASTTMEAGSSIRADALASGDGGRIVLWSDGLTTAQGFLSARGGAASGNGGSIETSGSKVDFKGLAADASAAHGKAGGWLLDPTDVVIGANEAGVISGVLNTGTDARTDSSGSITVNADIAKTAGGDASLTLHAGQNLIISDDVKISSTVNKLNVDFRADSGYIGTGDRSVIDTHGGAVAFTAGSYIGTGIGSVIVTSGGAVTFKATPTGAYIYTGDGSVIDTEGGAVDFTAGSFMYTGDNSVIVTNGGAVALTAGSYMYTGDSSVIDSNGGAVALTAGSYMYSGDNSVIGTSGGAVTFNAGSYMYSGDSSVIDTSGGAVTFNAGSYMYSGDSSVIDTSGGAVTFNAGSYMYSGDGSVIDTSGGAVNFTAGSFMYTGDNSVIVTNGGAVALTAGSYMYTGDSSVIDTSGGAVTFNAGSYMYSGDSSVIDTNGGAVTFNAGDFLQIGNGSLIDTNGGALSFAADLGSHPAAGGSGDLQTNSATIDMGPGSIIRTHGGNLTFYAGDPAAIDNRNWITAHPEGILLTRATIDTRDATGTRGGDIVMVGKGYDADGGAGISIDGATLLSASGNIGLVGYGGIGTTSGYAGAGVTLRLGDYAYGGKISTTSGTISISGKDGSYAGPSGGSASGSGQFGAPGLDAELSANGSITTTGGGILLRGDAKLSGGESGYAVDLSMAGGAISSGGRLEITGIGHQAGPAGLLIDGANGVGSAAPALSAGAGGMLLAGHSVNGFGVELENVGATTSGGGQISLAGESAGNSGVALGGVVLGGPAMTGNVAVRAYSGAGSSPMLAVQGNGLNATIQTSGVVAILPGGVDASGALTTHPEVPITVGDRQASGFGFSLADLGLGGSGASRVVVGSREQRGTISFNDATAFNGDLTLQNDAAGSGGIALNSSVNVSGQLTLSSGGTVTLGAPATITAARLLLHGAMPESNFQLAQGGNQVGQFGAVFDQAKSLQSADFGDVNFSDGRALTVASLAGAGFSSAGNSVNTLNAPTTVVAGDVLLQTAGNLTLGTSIATLGSDITLVTGGVFLNPANSRLLPAAGGNWRVFADSWVGEIRGGLAPSTPHPNLYGCSFGGSCAAGVSGNHFFYRARPVLTITPDSLARAYGDPNPALTYSANLINGDTLADAASGGYTTTALVSSPVGSYPTAGSFTSPVGYQIVVKPGSLAVNPAALLAIIDNKSKIYGDADPALTASFSGFKLGDTAAVVSGLTLNTVTGQAATAGDHPITGANASAPNYTIAYRPGVLSVAKAPLSVNIADQSKTYGDADPALSATFSGFRYADTAAVVSGLTLSTATGAAATAGTHPIDGANASAANYSFVYLPGTLRVAQAPLTVLVDDKRKQYGDADPALTYRLGGLKYEDSAASVGAISLSTATGAAATAGTHPIVATTGAASNYVVGSQPGVLTVDKAPLLVSADDKAKVYGDPDPAWTASATGLKYADTIAVVSGLAFAAPTGAAAAAGTHAITVSNGSAANYTLSYRPATLNVAKATLTVTADNKSKVYGAPEPALSATMSGFKYADSAAVVSGLVLSAPTGAAATAGTHPISAAGASAANYELRYLPGVLSVDPAVLSYVANPAIGFQDTSTQPLGGSVTGFAYGDTLASATTGQLAFSTSATLHSAPGAYGVLGGGLSSANYRFVQAASNDTALTMYVSPAVMRPTIAKDVTFDSSNLYEKNFGTPHVCVATGPLDTGLAGGGDNNDALAVEWSRVRVSPNLSNCLGLGQRNGCSDF